MWIMLISTGLAEDTDDETIVVEDSTSTTTARSTIVIDAKTRLNSSLADALRSHSGVFIQQLGGMGTQSSLSIRGTSSRQNLLLLNGIPLNPGGNTSINLQDISLHMLDSISLYRSHSPLRLMSASIGGVMDMHTTTSPQISAQLGIDNWANHWARGMLPIANKWGHGTIFLSGIRAFNEYPYFNNQNTPFTLDDDTWENRKNNDVLQGNLLGSWSIHNTDLLYTTMYKEQGVAGHIIALTPSIRMDSQQHLAGVHHKEIGEHSLHDLVAWYQFQHQNLHDPKGELGAGIQDISWDFSIFGGKGFHQLLATKHFFPSLGWMALWETAQNTDIDFQRLYGQGQIGAEFISERFEWSGNVLSHILSSSQNRVFFTPKTSFLFHFDTINHAWISCISGFRPPNLTELYGNQSVIVGNPLLSPEQGITVDGGWTRENNDSWLKRVQISIFARQTQNEIIYVQNAQRQAIPLNFAATRALGAELDWAISWNPHWEWSGSASLTHSENLSEISSQRGKELPNVPRWMNNQNIWWMLPHIWLGSNLYWMDGNYWDSSNQMRAPARFLQNIAMRSIWKEWTLEASIQNLWNRIVVDTPIDPIHPELGLSPQAVQDFLGYPLLGRTFSLSLQWKPPESTK